ncbi:c-type cytochrome [Paracoccus zhejiangensis]|uniref:Cytochrome C n=1 Tax=Paracoccus zhejiangensis TaxID=1077935 RepID=A0A2H5EYV7_9RHOB|nr:cytochrome c [Paracoccus zhejiangensis]AUH64464.1 cytochrome C [Paracoccus zhejiangensis]
MKLFLVAAIAAFPVLAHADAVEDALEARQGFMKMLSINMGTLAGMAKGDIAYDAAAATQACTNLEALSQYGLPALFIDGTSTDDGVETEALPAIWANSEDFATKFAGLQEAATGAGAAVGGGQEAVGPVVQKLGEACKACHDDYRKD